MSNETNKISNGTLYIQDAEGTWEKVARIDDAEWDIAPGAEWEHTGEPVKNFALEKDDFTIVMRMPKKDAQKLWRAVSPSRDRLRRLRDAKRRNRERRIRRWKDRVVTPPAFWRIIQKSAKRAQKTLDNFIYYAKTPFEKIISAAVPEIQKTIKNATEALLALPPEVFILDKSEEVDWKKAEHPQKPCEWNPEEASNDKREEEQGEHE